MAEHEPTLTGEDSGPKPRLRNWPPLNIIEKRPGGMTAGEQDGPVPEDAESTEPPTG